MEILVKVKVAEGIEMEVRGGPEVFVEALNDLPNMVSKLRSALAPIAAPSPELFAETQEPANLPSIEKPGGVQDAIIKVVSTTWGKSKPRTPKEIDMVLKNNAVHLSNGSLTGSLTLLVQSGKLRRLKVGSTYAYTLPISRIEEDPILAK
jgi:hypothetical protein